MRFLVFLIIFVSVSCKSLKKVEVQNKLKKEIPQIAFLYFNAIKTNDSIVDIQLDKIKKVEGKLKNLFLNKIPKENLKNKNWLVNFNSQNKRILQLQIHNPLVKELEYSNEQGQFERRTITTNNSLFVVRIPFTNSIKNITFEQIILDKQIVKTKFIDKIDL